MKPLPNWFRTFVLVVGTISPPLMARIAYRLFWDLGRPVPVRPEARAVHRAVRETVAVGARSAIIYRWGHGPETVLLVHGWRGRASQFAALIAALESPERTIVAFDAPGNGDAPGDRTDIRDYLALIRLIAEEAGGLDLLVGHSFGVIAVFVAVRDDVRARRLVSIAGVSGIEYTIRTFAKALALPARVDERLRHLVERNVFAGDAGIWRRFVSELDPTDETPLLVIHDADDRAVDPAESATIAESHLGPTTQLRTTGLGHSRVLSDPTVLRAVVDFAAAPIRH